VRTHTPFAQAVKEIVCVRKGVRGGQRVARFLGSEPVLVHRDEQDMVLKEEFVHELEQLWVAQELAEDHHLDLGRVDVELRDYKVTRLRDLLDDAHRRRRIGRVRRRGPVEVLVLVPQVIRQPGENLFGRRWTRLPKEEPIEFQTVPSVGDIKP